MSTIVELAAAGSIVKLDPCLDADQQEERCIYLLPHVTKHLDQLDGKASPLELEVTPLEQLVDLAARFASGEELDYPRQFHIMLPHDDGVWELKTPDLRLFGWFAQKDVFVCTGILDAARVKGTDRPSSGSLYGPLRDAVIRYREQLNLDPPKFVPGKNPSDVVSA